MRDYKARPGQRGRKPARPIPPYRSRRSRAPLPRGFRPLAAAQAPRSERPRRLARALGTLRALGRLRLRSVLLGAALAWLLAGLLSGAVALWRAPLGEVALTGNRVVPGAAVVQLAGLEAGLRMNALDPYELARRIDAHPRILSSDVRRLYPGRLAVRLREREPELRVRLADGRTAVVDRDNVVLELLPAGRAPGPEQAPLPLVAVAARDAAPSQPLDDPGIARARAALRAVGRVHLADAGAVAVDAGRPFQVTLLLPNGVRLIAPPERLEAALRIYRSTTERYPAAFEFGGAVDLTSLRDDGTGRIVLRRP
jgi:POTRA domain, FtsQ-type